MVGKKKKKNKRGGGPREIHVYWTDHSVILGSNHSQTSYCNL